MLLPNTLILSTLGFLVATSAAATASPHHRRSRRHHSQQRRRVLEDDASRVVYRGTAGVTSSRRNETLTEHEKSSAQLAKRDSYSGTATYFAIGLGACGQWSYEPQYIVAMNSGQFNALGTSYPSPQCFKSVTIQGPAGNTAVAQVMDECPTCGGWGDLDMSEALFKNFATLDQGVAPITWWFNDGSGSGGGAASSSSQWQAPTSTSTSVWQAPSTSSTPQWTPPASSSTQWVAPMTTSSSSSPQWTPSSSSQSQWVAPTSSSSSRVATSSSTSSTSSWSSSSSSPSPPVSSTASSSSLAINIPQASAAVSVQKGSPSTSSSGSAAGQGEQTAQSNLVLLSGLTAQYGSLVVNAAQQAIAVA